MIQEKPHSSSEDDFVRLDAEMEREGEVDDSGPKADESEEDQEPPVLSSVFAIDQLRQGAMTAASFFSWGFDAVKTQAVALTETEQMSKVVQGAKVQKDVLASNASQLWESTRPQRDEVAKTAASLGEAVQPAISKLKEESAKAIQVISSTFGEEAPNNSPSHDMEQERTQ